MKILVDREDIQEITELLYVFDIGGGRPVFPHPAALSWAREILQRILNSTPVDEQGLAI